MIFAIVGRLMYSVLVEQSGTRLRTIHDQRFLHYLFLCYMMECLLAGYYVVNKLYELDLKYRRIIHVIRMIIYESVICVKQPSMTSGFM
jgi:hypothetical protein